MGNLSVCTCIPITVSQQRLQSFSKCLKIITRLGKVYAVKITAELNKKLETLTTNIEKMSKNSVMAYQYSLLRSK